MRPYVAPVQPATFTLADIYGPGAGGRPTTAQIGNAGEVAAASAVASGLTRFDSAAAWLLVFVAIALWLGSRR